jgi:polysaccharide export outer membrane protein
MAGVANIQQRTYVTAMPTTFCSRIGAAARLRPWTVLFVLIAACATRGGYDFQREPDPRAQEFPIGPGDRLQINVWRDQELSTDARVRPDGAITVPLVGDIRASGRTASQIRDEIQSKLAAFMKSETAKVTVIVAEVRSYYFTVSGNVERPGLYRASSYVTVLEAVAMAGEPNRYANLDLTLLRREGTRTKRIPIDYGTLRRGERMEQNIVVLSGDNIVVP